MCPQDAHPPLQARPEAHGGHAALDPGPVQKVEGLLEVQDGAGFRLLRLLQARDRLELGKASWSTAVSLPSGTPLKRR